MNTHSCSHRRLKKVVPPSPGCQLERSKEISDKEASSPKLGVSFLPEFCGSVLRFCQSLTQKSASSFGSWTRTCGNQDQSSPGNCPCLASDQRAEGPWFFPRSSSFRSSSTARSFFQLGMYLHQQVNNKLYISLHPFALLLYNFLHQMLALTW